MKRTLRLLAATAVLAWVALPAGEALARAGGGTSGYSGGSRGGYSGSAYHYNSRSFGGRTSAPGGGTGAGAFMAILMFAGMIGVVMAAASKGNTAPKDRARAGFVAQQNEAVLRRLARMDDAWSPVHMRQRVEDIYFKVQEAWSERDQEICRAYVSRRLYARHKAMTDTMIREHRRNVLEEISFLDCDIIHIADRKGTRDDEFWAVVTGRMVDFEVTEGHQYVTFDREPKTFREVWKFVREDHDWVLDKIDQDISANLAIGRVILDEVPARA